VVLTQGPNSASGTKLVYALASKNVTLEAGRGRVRTHLVQTAQPEKAEAKPAQPSDGVLPGGSSKEPVQIAARRLEWRDATQTAVYTGDVTAVQGEGSMRASKLTVFIERDASAKQAAPGPTGSGRVRRIEAAGPVTLVQKDQVATGARAIYDKPRNRVELIGNVTLSQGPNITTGQRLVYDLATKQAVMFGSGGARAQAQFVPGSAPDPAKQGGPTGKRR
jgi:lipopolysaccharide export system protein LptA